MRGRWEMGERSDREKAEGCLVAVAAILLIVPFAYWKAFVAAKLWDWFVTPLFGVAVPSLTMLVGLMILVQLVTNPTKPAEDPDKSPAERIAASIGWTLMYYGFALAFGYLFHRISL
jgi:hypothetical protein